MNSLSIMWQVFLKVFKNYKMVFILYQHGEMIILRLIFINSDSPNPENQIRKILQKRLIKTQLETLDRQ